MNQSPRVARPRVSRLQFSLRLLLLAVTAFGIGFPVWYRWPYEEIETLTPGAATRITTWQRQWGGGKLKHGTERLILNGQTAEVTTYRRGTKHGPYRNRELSGQYADGMKEGVWIDSSQWFKRVATWRRDRLEGPAEIHLPDGRVLRLVFAAGRLTHFNGKPAQNRLFDLLIAGAIESRVAEELLRNTTIDCFRLPVKDLVIHLRQAHHLPMRLEDRRVPDIDTLVTAKYEGLDLCSGLTLLTAPYGLGCDYRYGCVWITSADDARDWSDPTGVVGIRPDRGTALGKAWNKPTTASALHRQLADVLASVAKPLAVSIDTRAVEPREENPAGFPVNANQTNLPFRDVLGYLLYQTGCRCELDGETLVILPQEER
jgi:hypothetical protein